MATELSVQRPAVAGVAVTYGAADATGNTFKNVRANVVLYVKNGSASSVNVTIDSQKKCDMGYDHDVIVAVPAGEERMIGPLTGRFNDEGNLVHVSYSAATSVTVAAVEH